MTSRMMAILLAAVVVVPVAQAQKVVKAVFTTEYSSDMPSGPSKPAKTGEFSVDQTANADPKSLEVPQDLQVKAKALVTQLGSTSFKERELASRELGKLGRFALPTLMDALRNTTEAEVAMRVEVLLPKAEAEDMKARVNSFLLDSEGKFEHTLPGWNKYKAVAGNDKVSRELFAEALKIKDCHAMLLAAERGSLDEASMLLGTFVGQISGTLNRFGGDGTAKVAKTGEMLMALFLEGQFSDKKLAISIPGQFGWGNGYLTVMNYSYNNTDFSQTMGGQNTKNSAVIKKVILHWMDSRETIQGLQVAMTQANTLLRNPKDALKYAAKLVALPSGPNDYYIKQNALTSLGTQNGKDHISQIAKCFEDTNRIWWGGQGNTPDVDIELRDFALAVACQLTEQKPEDYFMTRNGDAKTKLWNAQSFYFKDDRPLAERNPNGGAVRIARAPRKKEEEKKEDKDDKKDEKKDEKKDKLTQDDRRKLAFKKWDDWAKINIGKDGKLIAKEEPKKDETKKDEPKKDEAKKPDVKK